MIMLHMWMLNQRLLAEGDMGRQHQELIFEMLWEDCSRRIRHAGVTEMSVNKNLREIQLWSFGGMNSYDKAYREEKKGKRESEFQAALWRNLFQKEDAVLDSSRLRTTAEWAISERDRINAMEWKDVLKDLQWKMPKGMDRDITLDYEDGLLGYVFQSGSSLVFR